MKKLFVETQRKFDETKINLSVLDKLPGEQISLAAVIQYINLIPMVRDYLESKGKTVITKKGAYHEGHVLGCNASAFDSEADTMLLIGDGKFHALNNALQIQRPIHVFTTTGIELLSQEDIDMHNTKTRGKQAKFLASEKIGLLFSTKDGQRSKAIMHIRKAIEDIGKRAYIFESNHIDISTFENYPEVGIWINTACYGLGRDDPRVINLADIVKFL